jgi:hypothetical protein
MNTSKWSRKSCMIFAHHQIHFRWSNQREWEESPFITHGIDNKYIGLYSILVWKLNGKCPLGRPRVRWTDALKTHFVAIRMRVCGHQWLTVVNTLMNFWVW